MSAYMMKGRLYGKQPKHKNDDLSLCEDPEEPFRCGGYNWHWFYPGEIIYRHGKKVTVMHPMHPSYLYHSYVGRANAVRDRIGKLNDDGLIIVPGMKKPPLSIYKWLPYVESSGRITGHMVLDNQFRWPDNKVIDTSMAWRPEPVYR